jgi:hypothetical protein
MSEGKFFYIRSKLNNLVLEVSDALDNPGQPVVTAKAMGGDHQLWYDDQFNRCIRTKLNDDLVLEMKGDNLVVNNFEPDEDQQRWKIKKDIICHYDDEENVLDVANANEDAGAPICSYNDNGGNNQRWSIEHVPPKDCYIVSKMHGKVIDVSKGCRDAGTKIVMWNKKDPEDNDNQIWYEDKYGYIHSKLNGFVFDSSEGSMRLQPHDPTIDSRKWVKSGQKIVNKADPGKVLDIKGGDSGKGAKLQAWDYNAVENQHWRFEYL